MISHYTTEYNTLFDEFESFSFDPIDEHKLEQYKKEERSFLLLQTKLNQLSLTIKDKNMEIKDTRSIIEIIEEISKLKQMIKRYNYLISEKKRLKILVWY